MSAPANPIEYRRALGIRDFSPAWRVYGKAVYGDPLTPEERPLWKQISGGRTERPGVGFLEAFANAGRGSGKDDFHKSVSVFEGRHGGHEISGAPGQRLVFDVITPFRGQAHGFIRMAQGEARLPHNRRYIASETNDGVEFVTGTQIRVQTMDTVAVAGDTAIGGFFNEWSLWNDSNSSDPAEVVESNWRPSLRRVVGAPVKRLFKAGSSYIRDGVAWECFRDHFGDDDSDVLVVHGSTELFNPNIDKDWLARERKRLGELQYAMHFESMWQDAVQSGYFSTQAIERAVVRGVTELPRITSRVYVAIDAAFNETGDRFGWAVASARRGLLHGSCVRCMEG